MKKEAIFSAKVSFDMEDFNKSIREMKRQLKEIQNPSEAVMAHGATAQKMQGGAAGNMSMQTMDAYKRSTQQLKRELDQSIASQFQANEKLVKSIIIRTEGLKKLNDLNNSYTKGSKEQLAIQERIGRVMQTNAQQIKTFEQGNAYLNQAMRASSGLGGVGGGGGTGGNAKGTLSDWRSGGVGKALSGVAGMGLEFLIAKEILGAVGSAAESVANYSKLYAQMPMQRIESLGAATQGVFGTEVQNMSQGKVVEQMAYRGEKAKAMKESHTYMETERFWDNFIPSQKMIANVLGAVANHAQRSLLTSAFAPYIREEQKKFLSTWQTKTSEKEVGLYQKMTESLIKANPEKRAAVEQMQGHYMQDLQTQRMLGLTYQGFYGANGFAERANNAGFNPDLAAGMSASIQAAGGSTRGMNSPVMALQAQRGFDLTNAGSAYGRISGAAGSSSSSNQIFGKILEQSVMRGLDKSEFREENRKYVDITSQILNKVGVRSVEDAESIIRNFSKLLTNAPTTREIGATGSAYQRMQQLQAQTNGRMGTLQFAGLGRTKIAKSGFAGMSALMELQPNELIPSNDLVIDVAVASGMTPEQVIELTNKNKIDKLRRSIGLSSGKMDIYQKYMKSHGLERKKLTYEEVKALPENIKQMHLQSRFREPMLPGQSPGAVESESATRYLRYGGEESGVRSVADRKMEDYANQQVQHKLTTLTDRPGDEITAATGVDAQKMLKFFREFHDEITPTATAIDTLTTSIINLHKSVQQAPEINRGKEMMGANKRLVNIMAPTASKPKPGGH